MAGGKPETAWNDAMAVARLRTGDESAMQVLYDRYAPVVYAVALRVLADAGAAEDALQEVFLQLWRNPQSFDASRGSMAGWLAVIARHRAVDHLRKRRPTTDLSEIVVAVDADLEGAAERHQALEKVRKALGAMAAEQRSALEMAFFEGLTHVEIAERTGTPLGTVKTRIRAGLGALRKALAG